MNTLWALRLEALIWAAAEVVPLALPKLRGAASGEIAVIEVIAVGRKRHSLERE